MPTGPGSPLVAHHDDHRSSDQQAQVCRLMIPYSAVEVWIDWDGVLAGLPRVEEANSDYLDGNREYISDLRLSTWEDATEALAVERERVRVASSADDPDEFDGLLDGDLEDWELIAVRGLDVGVAAAVMALSAAGCLTSTSCRGHPELHRSGSGSEYPVIRFYADSARGTMVAAAAAAAGCGFAVDEGVGSIWAPSIAQTLGLAGGLLAMRPEFDLLRSANPAN